MYIVVRIHILTTWVSGKVNTVQIMPIFGSQNRIPSAYVEGRDDEEPRTEYLVLTILTSMGGPHGQIKQKACDIPYILTAIL